MEKALCGLSSCFLPSLKILWFLLLHRPHSNPVAGGGGRSAGPLGGQGDTKLPFKARRWVAGRLSEHLGPEES